MPGWKAAREKDSGPFKAGGEREQAEHCGKHGHSGGSGARRLCVVQRDSQAAAHCRAARKHAQATHRAQDLRWQSEKGVRRRWRRREH